MHFICIMDYIATYIYMPMYSITIFCLSDVGMVKVL